MPETADGSMTTPTPWTIDLRAATATHASGLVVRFRRAGPCAWHGEAPDPETLPVSELMSIARLMREAGEAFHAALKSEK